MASIVKIKKRPSNLNLQYYLAFYDHGINTLLDKDGDIVTEWIEAGKSIDDADGNLFLE